MNKNDFVEFEPKEGPLYRKRARGEEGGAMATATELQFKSFV